ncbi:MAG: DEAD/DEAH box helicase [Bacteroidota bacterium]
MTTFNDLGLTTSLLSAVSDLGFESPSEVQEKAIPILLEEETDLVALAQTGTGKTAAFGFPLLQKINTQSRTTQGLILSPTRELCVQITNEMQLYAKYEKGVHIVAIYGGASITEQAKQIKKGAQLVVATPGRMKDMIRRGIVDISKIEYCVLDEADEMLNMGFYEDIKDILSNTPEDKSTWLFSATMPKEVAQIARKFMHQPKEITVGTKNAGAVTVQHEYYVVGGRDRYAALKRLADANPGIFSVVFCRTKRDTQRIAEKLIEDGYNAGALHGDLSQNQRDLAMNAFRKKQIQLLVATDVAARGIDVDDITHVINYQLPDEIETYTHRSGRTGRAGKSGISMVIVTRSELRKIRAVEKKIQQKFLEKKIPTGIEICEIQLYHLASKIRDTTVNTKIDDYLPAIYDVLDGIDRDALIKKMVSVEFTRFYNYYSKTKDLGTLAAGSEDSFSSDSLSEDSVRYFINIGERDGFDWMSLKDFLRATLGLNKEDIYKVDTKANFSFFNTDAGLSPLVLETFQDFKKDGRFINVEVSKKPERSRKNRKNDRKKGRKRDRKSTAPKFKAQTGRKKKNKPSGFF